MTSPDCRICLSLLPDLLFDPASATAAQARKHLTDCSSCQDEFAELSATIASMDTWTAPEPSPWFDTRLQARLRTEQDAAPESFFERLRSRLLFSTSVQFRPVVVGGLALLLAIGSGTAVEVAHLLHPAAPETSATLQDLQILDRNDQAVQTMDQLLDDNGSQDDSNLSPAS